MARLKQIVERTLIFIVVLCAVYTALFLWVDRSVATMAHENLKGTGLHSFAEIIEKVFEPEFWALAMAAVGAGGLFVYFIKKDPDKARGPLLFAGTVFLALGIATVLKIGLGRYRPKLLFEGGQYGFHFLSTEHDYNSTPSGHSTAAFAGLLGIAYAINENKRMAALIALGGLACLIALSRLVVAAHFPSDILLGGAVGGVSVAWIRFILDVWYQRLEKKKTETAA